MELLLKKEIIDRLVDKNIATLNLSEVARQYFKNRINTNEIFGFFLDGVTKNVFITLINELEDPQIFTDDDIVHYLKVMIKKDVLTAVCEAMAVVKNQGSELSQDEKLNLLIDLKNIENPQEFQALIADSLEDSLNN